MMPVEEVRRQEQHHRFWSPFWLFLPSSSSAEPVEPVNVSPNRNRNTVESASGLGEKERLVFGRGLESTAVHPVSQVPFVIEALLGAIKGGLIVPGVKLAEVFPVELNIGEFVKSMQSGMRFSSSSLLIWHFVLYRIIVNIRI